MKAVQGDTRHAQLKMVSDVYSHIIDEDRRNNAMCFEKAFYQKPQPEHSKENPIPVAAPTPAPTADAIIQMLQQSPDLANQLLQALGNLTTAPISK